jgi:glycosyltransferase involved in cell wall biosynthesis
VNSVSVVVPTYNRGEALGLVLDRLLASDLQGLTEIEIVVVDDGSAAEAAPVVGARKAPPGFTLKCVRQENTGPAAARNLGFAMSHGDLVIFIDDDILVPPELVRQHVEAHALNPGSVVFGVCVPPPGAHSHMAYLLESLYANKQDRPRFERVSLIASGQLSVERKSFSDAVYASQLRTPAAEEFEFSARLRNRGIVALNATKIKAIHDQGFEISDVCEQQYKHGVGCAEAICRLPETLIMDELTRIAAANGIVRPCDPLPTKCRKAAKRLAANVWVRRTLILLCRLIGKIVPSRRINLEILSLVVGVFFFAGYREGLRRFARSMQAANLSASARRFS